MPPSNRGDRASMATAWKPAFLARPGRAVRVQRGQHPAVVVRRAADQVVVRRVAPVPAQPVDVGLETAAGADHRPGAAATPSPVTAPPVHRSPSMHQVLDRHAVAHRHAQPGQRPVVRVDQRLAAAQEEPVGPAQVQRAGQRRLPAHPVPGHPGRHGLRFAHGQLGQLLVARPGADAAQVPPQLGEQVACPGCRRPTSRARSGCSGCAGCCRRAARPARGPGAGHPTGASRPAVRAAASPALPPPITTTSHGLVLVRGQPGLPR